MRCKYFKNSETFTTIHGKRHTVRACTNSKSKNYGCVGFDNARFCKDCKDYCSSVVTRADKIRNSSDEELANILPCPYMEDGDECKYGWHEPLQSCVECKLEWLQSKAEGSET